MRTALTAVLMWCLAVAGLANDRSMTGVGGTWKPLAGEHATIRMVSERVHIDAGRRVYDVRATFVFRNEGPATTVTMGFPEGGGGDIDASRYRNKTGFTGFKTWVDGRPVTARRVLVQATDEYLAHWVKDVPFAAGQQRVVEVSYTSPIGQGTDGYFVSYSFTGGNWKGNVARSVFEVESRVKGDRLFRHDTKHTRTVGPRKLIYERTDWQAEEYVTVYLRARAAR